MYNIKEAAARSGLTIPTLRAWERRYGVVAPARTTAGYRLYDEDAIARLRRMRTLLASGWRAREAAEAVLRETSGAAPAPAAQQAVPRPFADEALTALIDQIVQSAAAYDGAGLASALDEAFARLPFEAAMDEIVFPALRDIGRGWEAGRISVAAEHAASHAVQRRLAMLYEAARRPAPRPHAVVGLPPGARHDAGALAFAVALRRVGLDTLYLGADVPVESWLRSLRESGARAAVIGVITDRDVDAARELAAAVRAAAPEAALFAGGRSAGKLGDDVAILPDKVGAAALEVAGAVAG